MAKYIVTQGPIEHDGKTYVDEAEISLPEAVAAPLVAAGAVEPKVAAAKPSAQAADES